MASLALRWTRPDESRLGFKFFVSTRARDMYENTLLKKGTNLIERNIALSDFESTNVKQQFVLRGWVGLCSGHVAARPEMVMEFLASMTKVNSEVGYFMTKVRGVSLKFSVQAIRDLVVLPVVENEQWPLEPSSLLPNRSEVVRELTENMYTHLSVIKQGYLAPQYRLLHHIVCSIIEPSDNTHELCYNRALLVYGIGRGYSIDLAWKIWNTIWQYASNPPGTNALPYMSLITRFLLSKNVPVFPDEPITKLKTSITLQTEKLSKAQIRDPKVPAPHFIPEPNYPIVEPLFVAIHPPMDFVPSWASTSNASLGEPPLQLPNLPLAQPLPNAPSMNLMGYIEAQFGNLNVRLDGFEGRLDEITTRLDGVDARMEGFETRLGSFDSRFEFVEGYNTQFSENFTCVRHALMTISSSLGRIENRLALEYPSPAIEDGINDDLADMDADGV